MGLRAKKSRIGNLHLVIPMVPGARVPRAKSKGILSGLGIWEFVSILLETNEQLPSTMKMTDEMMEQKIIDEFPNSERVQSMKLGKVTMRQWRSEYNVGRLTGEKPEIKSKRYTARGYQMDPHTGLPIVKGKAIKHE